jgi:hypothetical protein
VRELTMEKLDLASGGPDSVDDPGGITQVDCQDGGDGCRGEDRAEIGGNEVWRDPSVGTGARPFAALSLIHDISHLFGSAADPAERRKGLTNYETAVANDLGEPTRVGGAGFHLATSDSAFHT